MPSTDDTSCTVTVLPANASTWSNAVRPSRMLPSAARATSVSASSLTSNCSAFEIFLS